MTDQGRVLSRCLTPEPADSPHGGYGWTCRRIRWHVGKHRFGNYVWPLPCDCGCPPGDHADYRPTLLARLRRVLMTPASTSVTGRGAS